MIFLKGMALFLSRKHFIIFLVCLFMFPAFGQHGRTPPSRSFRQIFNKLFRNQEDKNEQCDQEAGRCLFLHDPKMENISSQKDTLQQCAVDLCGPPNLETSFFSYSDSYIKQMDQSDLMEKWEDEFQTQGMEEVINQWVDMGIKPALQLQKAFQESGLFHEPGFGYLKPGDYESLNHIFFDRYTQLKIDESKPPSDRLSIEITWSEGDTQTFKEGIKLYTQNLKEQIDSSFVKQIRYGIYTPQEAYALLQEKWETFTKKYKEEKKENTDFDRLKKIKKGRKAMRKSMRQLKRAITNFRDKEEDGQSLYLELETTAYNLENLERDFTKEKTGSYPEQQFLCQREDCRKILQELITELFSYYEKPLSRKKRLDYESARCLSEFVIFKQLKRELPEEELNIPDLKRRFHENVLKNFSIITREQVADYINNDFYIGPLIDFTQDFKNVVEDRIRHSGGADLESPASHEQSNSTLRTKNASDLIARMHIQRNSFLEGDINPLCKSVLENKDEFMPPYSMALTSLPMQVIQKGAITLSLFSCLHPHHGRARTFHEMGHLLSWMFAKKQLSNKSYRSYKKLRRCVRGRYKHLNTPGKYSRFFHKNDKLYTEEDTADLISYLVISDNETHYSCSLLDITAEGTQYRNLMILNDDREDSHSSPLLRTLFEAIHKRVELSSACQEVVNQYKNEINFEPCF